MLFYINIRFIQIQGLRNIVISILVGRLNKND